jgi:hypothetical protein
MARDIGFSLKRKVAFATPCDSRADQRELSHSAAAWLGL